MFQHGNFEHKMENTVGLLMLLAPIEILTSFNVALGTIIICGFSGSWFNIICNNGSSIPVVGASAIGYGCLPVLLFIFTKSLYKHRSSCWPLKDTPAVLVLGTVLPWAVTLMTTSVAVIYEGIMLSRIDSVSYAAHFGGILGGIVISAVLALETVALAALEKLENKYNSPVQSRSESRNNSIGQGNTGATEQTEMVPLLLYKVPSDITQNNTEA